MVSSAQGRRTIWVVDDSQLDVHRAQQALSPDYDVVVFSDGAPMLEKLGAGASPDVLVLDWVLPGLSGIDICEFIRSAGPRGQGLAILLLTGTRSPEQVVTALAAGANDFLPKPYSDAELRARVAALVRTRSLVERLEQAESAVRDLLAKAPDALLALDRHGAIAYANDAAGEALQVAVDDLIGRSAQELLPGLTRIDPAEIATGTGIRLPDVVIGARTLAPMIKASPSPQGVSVTVALRDVTDSRKEEMRRLDFYSMVAHDLRSPLSAMLLRCSLIQRGKYGMLPAALITDVHKMEATIRSLVAMINDFLEVARLEAAGLKLDRQQVNVPTLIEATVEELQPLADASQIALTFRQPSGGDSCIVAGDRRRLTQVLANLISNAIKFSGPGGVVEVYAERRDSVVEVAVRDNGPGIPADAIPTLFDRFTRAEQTQHKTVGTGLGLMIVRQVIEAHGGRVWVDSRLGEGSTFWFRLPTAPDARPVAAA